MVADRGTVTRANLEAIRRADGLERITALNAPQGKRRARTGAVQPSLFDEHNLAEITSEQFPGERPVICRNPLVAAERARKREALLAATETDLEPIARVERGTLADAARIGVAVGEVIKRHPCQTALRLGVLRRTPRLQRKTDQIAQEAALDGIYVLRTTVTPQRLDAPDVVRAYKQLKRGRTPTSQTSRTPLNLSNRAESTTDCTRNFGPCGRRRASARPRRGPASDQRRPASRRGALSGKR